MEAILGKDDAVRMREAASTIADEAKTIGEQREAFRLLHDLVENVDNANNMAKMHLWPGILSLLDIGDKGDEEARALRADALRLVALAAKNNEETQVHLVATGVLDKLVGMLETGCSSGEIDLSLMQRLIMALSAMAPARGSPQWDVFMEERSAACFEALLNECDGLQTSLQDGLVFLVLNYSWSRGHLPACLVGSQRLHALVTDAHSEHCDDPECGLASLPHRLLD